MAVVSALIVFHRDTPFLRPAIASLLNQSLRALDIVLVDNGVGLAPDALGEMGRDPRLHWVRFAQNVGIPAGHNAGVAAARGDFLALLDYDDIALPHRIERQVAWLRAHPELGLVSSLAETIDETGVVRGREFALVEPEAQRAYTQFAAPVVTPAYAGRREVFVRFPYREALPLTADFDFLARAAEAYPLAGVPEVLLHYRRYSAQTTEAKAVEIEFARGAVRLQTARRRRGEAEGAETGVVAPRDLTTGKASLYWAQRCLAENHSVVAAFQARRAVARGAQPAKALGLGLRAVLRARGAEKALTARMLFTGPVRALGLVPR